MTGRLPRPAVLSNPWLVTGLSVAALAVLILLLINPWSQPTIEPTKLRFYCAANATKAMEQIVQRYREQAGITQPVHPHLFRHQMLTFLTAKGLSDAQIQLISGHETKKSLEVYQHLSLESVKNAYQNAMQSVGV